MAEYKDDLCLLFNTSQRLNLDVLYGHLTDNSCDL